MKKRILAFFLLAILVLGLTAQAIEPRATNVYSSLTFSGTTATCKAEVTSARNDIDVSMELWQGGSLVSSWSGSKTGSISLSKTCRVTKGKTYTLKVYGTAGGSSFSASPVTKTCS